MYFTWAGYAAEAVHLVYKLQRPWKSKALHHLQLVQCSMYSFCSIASLSKICCRGCTYTVQPAKVVKSGLILHELAMLQRPYLYPFCRACSLLVQCDNKNSHTPNIFAILYYSPNKSDSMRRMYLLCFLSPLFYAACIYIYAAETVPKCTNCKGRCILH